MQLTERGEIFTPVCSLNKTDVGMTRAALMATFSKGFRRTGGKKAMSMIMDLKKMPRRERLKKLNLFSLYKED